MVRNNVLPPRPLETKDDWSHLHLIQFWATTPFNSPTHLISQYFQKLLQVPCMSRVSLTRFLSQTWRTWIAKRIRPLPGDSADVMLKKIFHQVVWLWDWTRRRSVSKNPRSPWLGNSLFQHTHYLHPETKQFNHVMHPLRELIVLEVFVLEGFR